MFKKSITLVTAFIIALAAFAGAASAATGTITGYPNFRSAPSVDSKVYGNLKKGQKVDVVKKVNNYWVQVRANGRTGYVSSNYINIGKSSTVKSSSSSKATAKANAIIRTGNKYLGTPYKFGAEYPTSRRFDCSSFTQYVFKQNGYTLPRTSKQQAKMGTYVSKSNLKKGDLMFFRVGSSKQIGHVAIYAGNGQMLHTYGEGGVRYTSINKKYWKDRYVTARRIIR